VYNLVHSTAADRIVVVVQKTDVDICNVCNAVHGHVHFCLQKDNAVEQTNGIMRTVAMSQKSDFGHISKVRGINKSRVKVL
jgi:hypothetical protein